MALVNSVNPYRLEGQKTAAFEICEQLGFEPDVLAIPVGNAGNISAYWKGFKEWHEVKGTSLPRMHGFEAQGAAAIVRDQVIENPEQSQLRFELVIQQVGILLQRHVMNRMAILMKSLMKKF